MEKYLRKNEVLYFYTSESPFVEKDIEIISSNYKVKRFFFNIYNKKKLLTIVIKQFLFLSKNIVGAKIIVCQFGGLHGCLPVLFARLFFKKAVIVAGGTDCVSFPSINYGNFSNKKNALFTGFCFKNASLILPVHESLVFSEYSYQPNDYESQGIKKFIPGLKTKIVVVYNGYDSNYWHNTNNQASKGKTFVTVLGHVNSKFTLLLKGVDLFIELARRFPDCTFSIIGGSTLKIENKPENLKLVSNIWGEKMIDVFSSNQFYLQLSMSEGFPNALSEAMLCECVPIVSNVGGMPDIVSDCGYILKQKDIDQLAEIVERAINNPDLTILGKKARSRIENNYTFEKRKKLMLSEFEKIV